MDWTSAGGMVSVGASAFLWVQVAGVSGVDVATMLIGAQRVLECIWHPPIMTDSQLPSCELLISIQRWCYMWQVPVTICLLSCLHFYHLETSTGLCGHCILQCQITVDSSSTSLQHSRFQRLPVQECSISARCWWMCGREMQLAILGHCVLCDSRAPQASSKASVYTM